MQYTKSVLEEQLKIGEKLAVGWPWRLLLLTIIIFAILTAIYFGMIFGYKPYLNSQIKNLDKEIDVLNQAIDESQQKNLTDFYSQVINVKNLLDRHPTPSKVFEFLEKNTSDKIYYISLNLSLDEKDLKLEGSALDYGALAQQLELFNRAPETEKVFLQDSKLSEERIRFSIRLIFKPELIR